MFTKSVRIGRARRGRDLFDEYAYRVSQIAWSWYKVLLSQALLLDMAHDPPRDVAATANTDSQGILGAEVASIPGALSGTTEIKMLLVWPRVAAMQSPARTQQMCHWIQIVRWHAMDEHWFSLLCSHVSL